MKKCPLCAEEIQDEAVKCRWCGEMLVPRPEALLRHLEVRPALRPMAKPGRFWGGARRVLTTVAACAAIGVTIISGLQVLQRETGGDRNRFASHPEESKNAPRASVVELEEAGTAAPVLLPFIGPAPVWPLTSSETWDLFGDLVDGQGESPVMNCRRFARANGTLFSGSGELQACLRPYLMEIGVTERALDLLFNYGLVVFRAEQIDLFSIADVTNFDIFGANYGWSSYIFSPLGILDVTDLSKTWEPLVSAYEKATSAEPLREAESYYLNFFDPAKGYPPIYLSQNEGDVDFYAPFQSDGWIIPFSLGLQSCEACVTPVRALFQVRGDRSGRISAAGFAGVCFDSAYRPNDEGDVPATNTFGFPLCPARINWPR